jgi:hypothetical protein
MEADSWWKATQLQLSAFSPSQPVAFFKFLFHFTSTLPSSFQSCSPNSALLTLLCWPLAQRSFMLRLLESTRVLANVTTTRGRALAESRFHT